MKATASTSFYFLGEMWLKGETKEFDDPRAQHYINELKVAGLVRDAKPGETVGAPAPTVSASFAELTAPPARAKRQTK